MGELGLYLTPLNPLCREAESPSMPRSPADIFYAFSIPSVFL